MAVQISFKPHLGVASRLEPPAAARHRVSNDLDIYIYIYIKKVKSACGVRSGMKKMDYRILDDPSSWQHPETEVVGARTTAKQHN